MYDIETESVNLYGEDLNAVLLRFRKSPEYLSILNDKVEELRAQLRMLNEQVQYYYTRILEEKVVDLLVAKNDSERHLRSLRSNFKRDLRDPRYFLREETTRTPPVNRLDQYLKQRQGVSTEKANFFKDMGFEYAGYAIHTIIKNMGPDDSPGKSTQLPFGGGHHSMTSTTTEHHEHVVTPIDSEVTVSDIPEATPPAEAFRYTYKHRAANR